MANVFLYPPKAGQCSLTWLEQHQPGRIFSLCEACISRIRFYRLMTQYHLISIKQLYASGGGAWGAQRYPLVLGALSGVCKRSGMRIPKPLGKDLVLCAPGRAANAGLFPMNGLVFPYSWKPLRGAVR